MNAVIYARYSSDKQTEDSIEAQIRACRAYSEAKGYQVVQTYVDEAISGRGSKTALRAQYQKMLRDSGKGAFETILVHKYDRIARNLGEHVNLEHKLNTAGVSLIAVAQDFGKSNEAKIMRSLVWAMSEYYIDNLSDETKKGLREIALKGLHAGGYPPFGYDVIDQQYVVNEIEAVFVRKIFQAAAHREGFKELIAELDAAGIRGKRGKPIKYTQIYEMLRNEKYTGVYKYSPREEVNRADRREKPNAIRIENAFPAIIEKDLFGEVQRIMNERKQTGKKAGYLCSGLVYCACGAKMHGHSSSGKGKTYISYRCSANCGFGLVRMDVVDTSAIKYLRDLLSEENQETISAALREYQGGEIDRTKDFNRVLKGRIDEKQKQYDTLMNTLSNNELPAEVVSDIGQRMQDLKGEIAALREVTPPRDFTTEQIKTWLNSLKNTPDEKAIHLLIERIDVNGKTDFNISSTLKSVLRKTGCGGTQHTFPTILFEYHFTE